MEEILKAIINLTNKVDEMKDEMKDMKAEMKDMKAEMKDVKAEMKNMKAEISKTNERIEILEDKIDRGFRGAMEERLEFFGIGSKFYNRLDERVKELERRIG